MLLIVLFVLVFSCYGTNNDLGSPSKVYDLLKQAAVDHPVDGNAGGSYLTMRSKEGAIFFVINIVGNFGTVFLDNGPFIEMGSDTAGKATTDVEIRVLQQSRCCQPCRRSTRICYGGVRCLMQII